MSMNEYTKIFNTNSGGAVHIVFNKQTHKTAYVIQSCFKME